MTILLKAVIIQTIQMKNGNVKNNKDEMLNETSPDERHFAAYWIEIVADDILKYFSYFFLENRLWHFMQISTQFPWNVKATFWEK